LAPSEVVAILENRLTDRSGAFKFNFLCSITSHNQTNSISSLFDESSPIKKMWLPMRKNRRCNHGKSL
jgi:hypothetical protein